MATKKLKSLDLLEPVLIKTFGLTRMRPPQPLLSEWLEADGKLIHEELFLLEKARFALIDDGDSWNEEELKMKFISIVIALAYFTNPIKSYYDREIGEKIGEHYLGCKPDMMLSEGIGEMFQAPYFFMHEYKREKKYSGDPIGQMLGAMLIGQAKNGNNKPVYGCYVQGRFWFFCVLEGKKFTISEAFDSSKITDAQKIIFILRKLKTIIMEKLVG